MADEEHLAILKQGVEAWNDWRDENTDIRPDLSYADLGGAFLRGALLRGAELWIANLSGADLQNADFTGAELRRTIFADTDLSAAKGLDSVRHEGPSEISISTLYKSKGRIPEVFLRGCGVPDTFISLCAFASQRNH